MAERDETLRRVSAAARRRSRADDDYKRVVREAVEAGYSLRVVAAAAGVSHVAILKMVRG